MSRKLFVKDSKSSFRDKDMTSVTMETDSRVNLIGHNTVRTTELLKINIICPNTQRFPGEEDRDELVRICSIAVSTVMMLARKCYKDITPEHVRYTEEYFRSLKQEDRHSHNVEQLLQLLASLKNSGELATSLSEGETSDENRDETTTNNDII